MFNLTIRMRLIATMSFMAVMLVIGGLMGMAGVRNGNGVIEEILTNQMPSMEMLANSAWHCCVPVPPSTAQLRT
jgi:hypothetical protein